MFVKIAKITGLVIIVIVVLCIALALAFGKPETKTEIPPAQTISEKASTTTAGGTLKKISIADFIKYVETYDAGGFEMEPRPSDPHSFIGISDDYLNNLEIDEKDGLVYKVILFTSKGQNQNETALSLARLIGISEYVNGNNEEVAKWIVAQLGNMTDGFVANKTIDNLRYEISWDTAAVLPKWKLQIEYL